MEVEIIKEQKYKKPTIKVIGRIEQITQRASQGTTSDLRVGGIKTN